MTRLLILRRIASMSVMLCLCVATSAQADASGWEDKQATALLDEGLMLVEWAKHRNWCVPGVNSGDRPHNTFQTILKYYPETNAAAVAEQCLPDALICLGRLDDAVSMAKSVVAKHPNTITAAYAQVRVGESMARAGSEEAGNAARELSKVAAMLPDRTDLGPLNESRLTLGSLCEQFIANRNDVIDAVELLGKERNDIKAKAEVLATVAAYRSRKGDIKDAVPLLDQLIRGCPGELQEINWARCRVAISYLRANGCQGAFAPTALGWLREVPTTQGDALAAEACLWQARYHAVHGPVSDAVSVLEDGKPLYLNTAHGAEILYGLGCALEGSGKHDEAAVAMREVAKLKLPTPFYGSLAEFFVAQQQPLGKSDSVVSAMRIAESGHSTERRFLAYCPVDPLLSPGWLTAAQLVSLIKEGLNEEALRVASALPVSANLSPSDLLRARGEVLLCSMRSASTLDSLLDKQPDTIAPLVWPKLSPRDKDIIHVRADLLDVAQQIVSKAGSSRCSSEGRRTWLVILASAYAQFGRYAAAIKLYNQSLGISRMSHDARAETEYTIGTLYWKMGQRNSAYSVMQRVSQRYSDTCYGEQGRRIMNGWKIVEQLQTDKGRVVAH